MCLPKNSVLFTGFGIAIQIILILFFLILLFILYTKPIEIKSFKNQTNFIMDDIIDDIDPQKLFLTPINKKTVVSGINKVLDYNKAQINKKEQPYIRQTTKQNNNIILIAILIVIFLIFIVVIITLILTKKGHCFPFRQSILDAVLIVIVIAITEIYFLTFIAEKYISVRNITIRKHLGEAISKYAKIRKKLKN